MKELLECNGIMITEENGRFGIMDHDRNILLPIQYDGFHTLSKTRNGLVLRLSAEGSIREFWYDYESRILHRDLRWMENFEEFDTFLIDGKGASMPLLKMAGQDQWVKFPGERGVDPLREIPLGIPGVHCILCMEETKDKDCLYEYFFLLLYRDGWMPTPAQRSLAELYADLPAMIEGLVHRKKDREETEKKQVFSLLCNYKKENEEWD